jgi:uncharacterized protein involved in oxidation of intracellular sulfur
MKLLLILSHPPYDGADVAWNALRYGEAAREAGHQLRLFLLNQAVDIARPTAGVNAEFNLAHRLGDLIQRGAEARLCATCLTRCGITQGQTIPEAPLGRMSDLVAWTEWADRVVTF